MTDRVRASSKPDARVIAASIARTFVIRGPFAVIRETL